MVSLASTHGTYALILSCTTERRVPVGRFGQLHIEPGFYVYVGSAFGPGGVRARLWHHHSSPARPHWHIDSLRGTMRLIEVWYTYDPRRREHQWATVLEGLRGASVPMQRFGASDCACVSHLYFFATRPLCHTFRRKVHASLDTHQPIYLTDVDRL